MLWPCWCLQEGEWWREAIFHADKLDVVCPGGGIAVAHLENVYEHGVYSAAWIAPYVMEEAKGADVQQSFNRKFSKKEVYSRYR